MVLVSVQANPASVICFAGVIDDALTYQKPTQASASAVERGLASDGSIKLYSNTDVTRARLYCLKDGGWANDDIINEFARLLTKRQRQLEGSSRTFPLLHFFDSHFYSNLTR